MIFFVIVSCVCVFLFLIFYIYTGIEIYFVHIFETFASGPYNFVNRFFLNSDTGKEIQHLFDNFQIQYLPQL